jgi:hypothetical protein
MPCLYISITYVLLVVEISQKRGGKREDRLIGHVQIVQVRRYPPPLLPSKRTRWACSRSLNFWSLPDGG